MDDASFGLQIGNGTGYARRTGDFRLQLPLLVLLSVALLVLSRLDHSLLRAARWSMIERIAPALAIVMEPFEPIRDFGRFLGAQVTLHDEVSRLRQDKRILSSWEWRARELERRLADLQKLSNVVQEPLLEFTTARVVGDASGAFAQSVIVGAGTATAIRPGYPVINGDGLVGRVVETGASAARVLLVTDGNSRIPVLVGDNAVRAILEGDNGTSARLRLLDQPGSIAPGDVVFTSGVGGLFPKGLKVGIVKGTAKPYPVEIAAKLHDLEYVSILRFDSPTLDAVSDGISKRPRANGLNDETSSWQGAAPRAQSAAPGQR